MVREFKLRNIQPQICRFRPRSVMICCEESDRPVTSSPASPPQCGVSNTRRIFNFNLRARQGEVGLVVEGTTSAPVRSVVGGVEAEVNSYPWMAALGSREPDGSLYWFCGGSYIGQNLVLTAAHCIPDTVSGLSLDVVRLGAHDLSQEEEAAQDWRVKEVVIHPQYNSEESLSPHDIAILALDTSELDLGPVSPVCLSSSPEVPAGSRVLVAGWGATSEGGVLADRLQEVELQVTDQERCEETFSRLTGAQLGPGTICAGHDLGGRDACQGDSGGGLLLQDQETGSFQQVGIISGGIGCGRRDLPGVYTRVSHYAQWIEEVKELL